MGRTPREIAEEFHHEDVVKFLKACEEELDNPSSGFAQLRNPAGYGNKEEYLSLSLLLRGKLSRLIKMINSGLTV